MPPTIVCRVQIDDGRIGRHFRHHDRYMNPPIAGVWEFTVLRVPLDELVSFFGDPGFRASTNPRGLMGSIGLPALGYRGARIVDLANKRAAGLAAGSADIANPALATVLAYRDGGSSYIYC